MHVARSAGLGANMNARRLDADRDDPRIRAIALGGGSEGKNAPRVCRAQRSAREVGNALQTWDGFIPWRSVVHRGACPRGGRGADLGMLTRSTLRRNNTLGRRSLQSLFTGRAAWAVWAVLIVPLFATIAAPPALAQITAGPGQSVTVPAGDTITCTN